MREVRLGDDIDDYCVRCKRIMNHSVVSVMNGVPAKVRCRTCHSDHDYRHELAPPPKVDARKQALFQEVLKKVNPEEAAEMSAELVEDTPIGEVASVTEAAPIAEAAPIGDAAPIGEAAAAAEATESVAPKAKAKARGKQRS